MERQQIVDQETLNNLASALSSACNLIQDLGEEIKKGREDNRESAIQIALINHNVKDMTETIASVLKYVRDGNGKPSLLSRVEFLESKEIVGREKIRGLWIFLAATVGGLFGFIGQIISSWFSSYSGKPPIP